MYYYDPFRTRRYPARRQRQTITPADVTRADKDINWGPTQPETHTVIEPRQTAPSREAAPQPEPTPAPKQEEESPAPEIDWQAKAMELQAEFENFRKRQIRRADEAITAEKARLLKLMLPLADNLDRALAQAEPAANGLREGVALTHRELMRRLEAEGVSRIETLGQPLDPRWHEALAAIPAQAEPGTIVEEVEAGYKLDEKLLRPAKVVVAS